MNPSLHLVEGGWEELRDALTRVRFQVFVVEQHVPESLELDEHDARCHHVLVTDSANRPVGTGRILPDGHIGRMAVVQDCRGQGVGTAILNVLLGYAREQGNADVFLHAQVAAIPFYEKSGFTVSGEPFMDAGIPHRRMVMRLP